MLHLTLSGREKQLLLEPPTAIPPSPSSRVCVYTKNNSDRRRVVEKEGERQDT